MIVTHSLDSLAPHPRGRAVTVGVFDGVHRGHRLIVRRLAQVAAERGWEAVAVTFHPHPLAVVAPDKVPPELSSLQERIALLGAAGTERVVVVPFDADLAALPPEEFVQRMLVQKLQAQALFEGPNFRFGRAGQGDCALLRRLGEQYGFSCEVVGPVLDGGEMISSSLVRQCLGDGDVARAARLLGRPYRVAGTVVQGDRRGHQLGFPTANLALPANRALPARAVYAAAVFLAGADAPLPAMANLGVRPTVGGGRLGGETLEVHLIDWQGDLYGQELQVDFLQRLRDEQRFPSLPELSAQLGRDRMAALHVWREQAPYVYSSDTLC